MCYWCFKARFQKMFEMYELDHRGIPADSDACLFTWQGTQSC